MLIFQGVFLGNMLVSMGSILRISPNASAQLASWGAIFCENHQALAASYYFGAWTSPHITKNFR